MTEINILIPARIFNPPRFRSKTIECFHRIGLSEKLPFFVQQLLPLQISTLFGRTNKMKLPYTTVHKYLNTLLDLQ